jgi:hypothetical protein
LHPPIDGHVIYGDAPFGQQFLHTAIVITSGGNRKPAKPDFRADARA